MFAWPQISRCKMSAGRTEIWELWKKNSLDPIKIIAARHWCVEKPFRLRYSSETGMGRHDRCLLSTD